MYVLFFVSPAESETTCKGESVCQGKVVDFWKAVGEGLGCESSSQTFWEGCVSKKKSDTQQAPKKESSFFF